MPKKMKDHEQIRFPVEPTKVSEQDSINRYDAKVVLTRDGYKIQYGAYILGSNTWDSEAEAWEWLRQNGNENR